MRAWWALAALSACNYDLDSIPEPCSFAQRCTTAELPYCGDDLHCTSPPRCTPTAGTIEQAGMEALGFSTSIDVPAGQSMLVVTASDNGAKVVSITDNANAWQQVAAATGPTLTIEIWAAHFTAMSAGIAVNYDKSGKHVVIGIPMTCLAREAALISAKDASTGSTTTIGAGSITTDRVSLILAVVNTGTSVSSLTTPGFTSFEANVIPGAIANVAYVVAPPGTYAPTWMVAGGVMSAGLIVALSDSASD